MNNIEKLIKLVQDNPELPVVAMVKGSVDEYTKCSGYIGESSVRERAVYDGKVFFNREKFREAYCYNNIGALCRCLDMTGCLNKKADEYFHKVIIVNIDLPE